jgi:CRISPR/Cas system-associated exonuclease Cas4 (RecB family)
MTETSIIVCDAGRGTLPRSECLDCALKGANTCGYDYSMLLFLLNDKERTGIHVTDLTSCLRNAYYARTRPAAEFPHEILIRKLGTAVHAQLENDNDAFVSEMPLEALGVVGTADVYYKTGRIIDHKTTRWLTPSRLPYGSHALQVNYYAAILRKMGKPVTSAAIQYIDMSGPTKCRSCSKAFQPINGILQCPKCGKTYPEAHTGAALFEIPLRPHEEVVEDIEERRNVLQLSIDEKTLPQPEQSFLCDYCPFVSLCNDNSN